MNSILGGGERAISELETEEKSRGLGKLWADRLLGVGENRGKEMKTSPLLLTTP